MVPGHALVMGFFGPCLCSTGFTGAKCYGENIMGKERDAGQDDLSCMELLAGICILVAIIQRGGRFTFRQTKPSRFEGSNCSRSLHAHNLN